jgi:cytochrome c
MTPQLHRRLTKIVAFLTALRGSALIMVSGEQVGSTEKWTTPAAEARKKNPVAVTESSLTAGQKIYLKRCVACHGKTGNGDGPDAADLGKPRPTPIKSHLIFARLIHARPPFSLPCSRAIAPPSWQARTAVPVLVWWKCTTLPPMSLPI